MGTDILNIISYSRLDNEVYLWHQQNRLHIFYRNTNSGRFCGHCAQAMIVWKTNSWRRNVLWIELSTRMVPQLTSGLFSCRQKQRKKESKYLAWQLKSLLLLPFFFLEHGHGTYRAAGQPKRSPGPRGNFWLEWDGHGDIGAAGHGMAANRHTGKYKFHVHFMISMTKGASERS